jgi:hypothetical protein
MKRAMIAATALCLAVGCDKAGEGGTDQAKAAGSAGASSEPGKHAAPQGRMYGRSFAGTYLSTWGDTVFTHVEDTVTATYPGGKLVCAADNDKLECTWREESATGKARLYRKPDGIIEGTWGHGLEDKGSGVWTFTPKPK